MTKDEEFESQLSQLISESLKEANKERLRAPPVVAKGKKALKQQKPIKKLIEQAAALDSAKGMVVLTKQKTKALARIEIPSHSSLMMSRGVEKEEKKEEEDEEQDYDLKKKTLMLAGGGQQQQ